MVTDRLRDRERLALWPLLAIHIVVCCYSLVRVAAFSNPDAFNPATFHIFFHTDRLPTALLWVMVAALVALPFVYARFSFGYFVGFYLYTIVFSYLWLNSFTNLGYDHRLGAFSILLAMIAFLLPALSIGAPLRGRYRLSQAGFDRLLLAIVVLAAVTIAVSATYHFRLASLRQIYEYRDKVELPRLLNYLIGTLSTSLLPFAFAGFVIRKAYRSAAVTLLLLLFLYPVTLSKLALFAPFWLCGILLLAMLFRARTAVVLSLLLPIAGALVAAALFPERALYPFALINFRMIAIPATAIDVYSHFFSHNELAHFCQISFLKPLMHCPYGEQLSVLMDRTYGVGNVNASLLATEGIASVGLYLAPLAVLGCGVVVGIGNRFSHGLPVRFILLSGAILTQVMINVPLSTALLTHGAGLLFLLWYLTPRTIFAGVPAEVVESPPEIDWRRWRGIAVRFIAGLSRLAKRHPLPLLLACHVVVCCISLAILASYHSEFHIFFDPSGLGAAILLVLAFGAVAWLFAVARFSAGYLVGFGFYTMVLGYLWLNLFSDMNYDHHLAGLSAAASAVAFLIPALFITSPLRQAFSISPLVFDRLLTATLAVGAATVAIGSLYNFRIVSITDIYDFREQVRFPLLLNYWIGATSGALLPFAFGCFVLLRSWRRAAIALVLLLLFYPLTLSKLAFFAPAWLLAVAAISAVLSARLTVVTVLLAPSMLGVILIMLFPKLAVPYFDLVNLRLIAVPSNSMDFYNEFFFQNEVTRFCQISLLKPFMNCPYHDQLSVVMSKTYGFGNTNASLFATEGIASVGTLLAPLAVFACGLVLALANRLSAGLPPRLILISGNVVAQVLLNVPLTTTLLSHGAALLFLLWYIAPRSMFEDTPPAIDAPGRSN
jgi:hypothetical protein